MLNPKNGLAPGDPNRMAARMIKSADVDPVPQPLVLGSQAMEGTPNHHAKAYRGLRGTDPTSSSRDLSGRGMTSALLSHSTTTVSPKQINP